MSLLLGREKLVSIVFLCLVIGFSLFVHLWGLKGDLPLRGENDEGCFIGPAIQVALFKDPNPHQFINPGSTVIYPLALSYMVLDQTCFGGRFFFGPGGKPRTIWEYIYFNPERFHLPLRILSMLYSVACIPMFFLLIRKCTDWKTSIVGLSIFATIPLLVEYGHIGRTDSAALFFALCCLWRTQFLLDGLSLREQVFSGMAAGLAIASRYFMVVLLPVTAMACWLSQAASRSAKLKAMAISGGAALATLAVSSPFLFLDFGQVAKDLDFEATSTMVGADGLSPIGNFVYYISDAIPNTVSWPLAGFALLGGSIACWRRDKRLGLLILFVVCNLIAISMNNRHWQRWVIPTMPCLSILAAYGMTSAMVYLSNRMGGFAKGPLLPNTVLVLLTICLLLMPINTIIVDDLRASTPSTAVEAAQWINANLKPGSKIIQDMDMVRIDPRLYEALSDVWRPDFVKRDHDLTTVGKCLAQGYEYVVINDIAGRYLDQPKRFPNESSFYKDVFQYGKLLVDIQPQLISYGMIVQSQRGGRIRIYQLEKSTK